MRVTILGCGEAFDETLPNTSMLVRTSQAVVLLECGYSAPPRVWAECATAGEIGLICISHAHADHYFGLPALLGRMWEEKRTEPLIILTQPSIAAQIRDILEYGYRALAARFQFPVEYLAAVPGETVHALGASFQFAPTLHSVTNLAVRIEAGRKSLCYSGDGMFTEASRKLFEGADLVLHEAFSFEESPVHADIPRLLAMGAETGAGELGLVHVQRGLRRNPARIHEALATLPAGPRASLPEPGHVYEL